MLKGEKYLYSSMTKAVESMCKCFYAIQSWPSATDHIYYFFNKIIFKLDDISRNLSQINSFVSDLKLEA